MAKSKLAPKTEGPTAEVARAITKIRRFHRLGTESVAQCRGRLDYVLAGLSKAQGEKLGKARAFAWRFSKAKLDKLCRLIEQYDFPLSQTHIIRCLSVPESQCDAFIEDALAGRWGRLQLNTEIRKRLGQRHEASRQSDPLEGVEEAYRLILLQAERWQHVYYALCELCKRDDKAKAELRNHRTPAIRENIETVQKAMVQLQGTLRQKLRVRAEALKPAVPRKKATKPKRNEPGRSLKMRPKPKLEPFNLETDEYFGDNPRR